MSIQPPSLALVSATNLEGYRAAWAPLQGQKVLLDGLRPPAVILPWLVSARHTGHLDIQALIDILDEALIRERQWEPCYPLSHPADSDWMSLGLASLQAKDPGCFEWGGALGLTWPKDPPAPRPATFLLAQSPLIWQSQERHPWLPAQSLLPHFKALGASHGLSWRSPAAWDMCTFFWTQAPRWQDAAAVCLAMSDASERRALHHPRAAQSLHATASALLHRLQSSTDGGVRAHAYFGWLQSFLFNDLDAPLPWQEDLHHTIQSISFPASASEVASFLSKMSGLAAAHHRATALSSLLSEAPVTNPVRTRL